MAGGVGITQQRGRSPPVLKEERVPHSGCGKVLLPAPLAHIHEEKLGGGKAQNALDRICGPDIIQVVDYPSFLKNPST
jgi:hypothetical protein